MQLRINSLSFLYFFQHFISCIYIFYKYLHVTINVIKVQSFGNTFCRWFQIISGFRDCFQREMIILFANVHMYV